MTKIGEAGKEVHDGISQFEQTLTKHGIKPVVKREDAERAVSEHLSLTSPMKTSLKGGRFSSSVVS
jgi:hypothetical protein